MRVARIILGVFLSMLFAASAMAQGSPVKDGSVWSISYIKVKPGMFDVYMRDLAATRKPLMEQAKKDGLVLSEKMLTGSSMGRDDYDLMLMVEYKNFAAFDGLDDKFEALAKKITGPEDKQMQLMVKRTEVREILGQRVFQEVSFK